MCLVAQYETGCGCEKLEVSNPIGDQWSNSLLWMLAPTLQSSNTEVVGPITKPWCSSYEMKISF